MRERHVHEYIVCGALSAYIARGDNWDATVIAVQVGDAEPWFVVPFGHYPAERLIAIDERYFLALGNGPKNIHCFAVFDAVDRKQASRLVREARIHKGCHLVVSADRKRLWHVYSAPSQSWTLPELEELPTIQLPHAHVRETAVRADGAIIARGDGAYTIYGDRDRPRQPHVFAIAPDGESVSAYGVTREQIRTNTADPHSNYHLSPDGRVLVRPHDGSLLLTDADGNEVTAFAALTDISDEDVVPALERLVLHGAQEIWDAAPMVFRHRVVVRSKRLIDCLPERPLEEDYEFQLRKISEAMQRIGRNGGVEYEGALAEHSRLGNAFTTLAMGRSLLRFAVRYAEASPFEKWSPGDPEMFERGTEKDIFGFGYVVGALNKTRGFVDSWLPDGSGVMLRFSPPPEIGRTRAEPDEKQRLSFDGKLGPIELLQTPPLYGYGWTPIPEELGKRAREFIQKASTTRIALASREEASCIAALDELALRLETNSMNVIWGREMTLKFDHSEGELSEEEFFSLVVNTCPNAVHSLRRVMAAIDAVELAEEVWSTETVSASGFPAWALAVHDPEAFRFLEGYFALRDPGHEPFGLEVVLPALAPFRDMEGLRFGLRRLYEENAVGHGDNGAIAMQLLRDAEAVCAPEVLAAAAKTYAEELEVAGHGGVGDNLFGQLRAAADMRNTWHKKLVKELSK